MKKVFRIVLAVLAGCLLIYTLYFLWKKSQPEIETFSLVELQKGDIYKKTLATGKIEPRDEVLIKPQISGIVTELYKEVGQTVKKGDVIAKVTVIPEMGSLNSAQSALKSAEIRAKQSEREYNRTKDLFEQSIVTLEEFEKTETDWFNAQEELSRAQNQLDIVTSGISKQSQGFNNTEIRSTIDGIILDVPIKVGNSVILSNTFNDGTTIASVADLRDMIFIGSVDETEVGQIKKGMSLKLMIGAMPDIKFDAILEYISPKAKDENGATTFEIKAAAQIPDSIDMRAGYSANAEIILEQSLDVDMLPENTIHFENDSSFVYFLTSDSAATEQTFDKRLVEIGLSDGLNIEIMSGVDSDLKIRGNKILKN